MSWQGNECFVGIVEYENQECEGKMLDAIEVLLDIYGAHGNGWYLLGNVSEYETEDDCDPFEVYRDGSFGSGWLPNPFMPASVMALNIRSPRDLLGASFECWDNRFDCIAYAGDGDEPLERVTVYGETYDMR